MTVDGEFAKWLATLGVGGALAGVIFMFYRKDMKMYADLWQGQSVLYLEQTKMLVTVVREQTTASVQLTGAVEALHRRLDDEGYPRVPRLLPAPAIIESGR